MQMRSLLFGILAVIALLIGQAKADEPVALRITQAKAGDGKHQVGQFQDGREHGCKNHCQTDGCDEGHIPQDPAIALLWIAFVHTREKGVHVTSTPRIIELLDNLFVFFRFCRHFLLPSLFVYSVFFRNLGLAQWMLLYVPWWHGISSCFVCAM